MRGVPLLSTLSLGEFGGDSIFAYFTPDVEGDYIVELRVWSKETGKTGITQV